jgi:hypothetical protein
MDDEGFRPEDFETQTPGGFIARAAGHFLNDLDASCAEGWEIEHVLFGVVTVEDGQRFIRWRPYPGDATTAARIALEVVKSATARAEREQEPEDRARSNAREIRDRRRAGLLKIREGNAPRRSNHA